METILNAAASENRNLTAEEAQKYDRMESDLEARTAEVKRLEKAEGIGEEFRDGRNPRDTDTDPERVAHENRGRSLTRAEQLREVRKSPEYADAMVEYLRHGNEAPAEVRAALQVGTDSEGGYLVPDEWHDGVILAEKEWSVIRRLATVVNTENNGSFFIPAVDEQGAAAKIAEEGSYAGTDPTFTQRQLDSYKYGQIVKIADELVSDSRTDIVGLVSQLGGRALGLVTGEAYTIGDGSGDPNGVATAASAGVTMASGNTANIDFDALIDLIHSVVSPYRSRPSTAFVMKDATIAHLRKKKTGLSGDNTMLWQPSPIVGQPDSLLGYPCYGEPYMASLAASAKVVLFGDFSQYWIRDVGSVEVKVLNERYADTGQIGVRFTQRTDGELADTAAVKALVTSAT